MPHGAMVLILRRCVRVRLLAMAMGRCGFQRQVADTAVPAAGGVHSARCGMPCGFADLDGGGMGCANMDGRRPTACRRLFDHLPLHGLLLEFFAATCVANPLAFPAFQWEAPYAWYDLPRRARHRGRPRPGDRAARARDREASARPGACGRRALGHGSGLRPDAVPDRCHRPSSPRAGASAAMGLLLALHLGVVFALFVTMPYGKFVHGLYRTAAWSAPPRTVAGRWRRHVRPSREVVDRRGARLPPPTQARRPSAQVETFCAWL